MKTILKFIAGIIGLGTAAGLVSCAASKPRPPAKTQDQARRELQNRIRNRAEPAVLFIGNSYSFGVPRELGKLTRRAARPMRTGEATHSGWSLARHASTPSTLRKLREGGWDVVVLQEFSRNPSIHVSRETMMVPGVRILARIARENGAVPVLYQTWGGKHGDPAIPGDNFPAMNRRVRDGYRIASHKAGGLLVIPAGDAWERELKTNPDAPFFQPDGAHPTRAGDAVTARVFYQNFFGEEAP